LKVVARLPRLGNVAAFRVGARRWVLTAGAPGVVCPVSLPVPRAQRHLPVVTAAAGVVETADIAGGYFDPGTARARDGSRFAAVRVRARRQVRGLSSIFAGTGRLAGLTDCCHAAKR
jgi:hypothetical protein